MENLHDIRVGERWSHHRQVANSQRIDNGNFAFDSDLHQTELCVVRFLAQKLGIYSHVGTLGTARHKIP